MAKINLLTTKIAPKSSVIKTSNTLKVIGLVWTVVFFVAVLVMVSIFLINSQQIRSSVSRQEQLKSAIRSLERTEQQYTLLKDRVTKINDIYAVGDAIKDLEKFYDIYLSFPEGATLERMEIGVGMIESSFLFNDSQTLTESFVKLLSNGEYDYIQMNSFSFSPERGYQVLLTMNDST